MDYKIMDTLEYDKDIDKVLALDGLVYEEKYRTTKKQILERNKKGNNTIIIACDDDNIVGYINYFPITSKMCKKMKSGDLETDIDISSKDMTNYKKGCSIYVMSFVVHPEYRSKRVALQLIDNFMKHMTIVRPKEIMAMVISRSVRAYIQRIGFIDYMRTQSAYIMLKEMA